MKKLTQKVSFYNNNNKSKISVFLPGLEFEAEFERVTAAFLCKVKKKKIILGFRPRKISVFFFTELLDEGGGKLIGATVADLVANEGSKENLRDLDLDFTLRSMEVSVFNNFRIRFIVHQNQVYY